MLFIKPKLLSASYKMYLAEQEIRIGWTGELNVIRIKFIN